MEELLTRLAWHWHTMRSDDPGFNWPMPGLPIAAVKCTGASRPRLIGNQGPQTVTYMAHGSKPRKTIVGLRTILMAGMRALATRQQGPSSRNPKHERGTLRSAGGRLHALTRLVQYRQQRPRHRQHLHSGACPMASSSYCCFSTATAYTASSRQCSQPSPHHRRQDPPAGLMLQQ